MKSLINKPLLIEQLKRFWLISALSFVAYLLTVIVPLLNARPSNQHFMIRDILSMQHPMLIVAIVIVPFCVVMALSTFHFNGTSALAFYSFPITKKQLFLTNFATGTILLILPLILMSIFLLIPIYTPSTTHNWANDMLPPTPGTIINTFPVVTRFFIRMAISFIFYFGVFTLAASVAGNRVISILLCMILPFIPTALLALVLGAASLYIFGVSDMHFDQLMTSTISYTNPLAWSVSRTPFSISYYIVYIAIAIALFCIAYVCSYSRKLERTGDSVVFIALKNVLVFLLSILGMIAMGAFIMYLTNSRIGLYFGFMLGFVLAYFIAQMIAEKTFNIKHKAKTLLPYSIIILGLYTVMLIITNFGMGFYVTRIPDMENIAEVSLMRQWNWQSQWEERDWVSNEEIIARTRAAHREILDNRGYLRRVFWNDLTDNRRHIQRFDITYRLENGNLVRRQYRVSNAFMERHGLTALQNDPIVRLARYTLLNTPAEIDNIRLEFTSNNERTGFPPIRGQAQLESLLQAIKADYILHIYEANQNLNRSGGQFISFTIDIEPIPGALITNEFNSFRSSRWNEHIRLVTTRDRNIYTWLEEHGYLR